MPRVPDPPGKIKPEDLRSECQACGGSGKASRIEVLHSPLLNYSHQQRVYSGPCARCNGTGRTIPRKAYR